jgi:hypothetical protein
MKRAISSNAFARSTTTYPLEVSGGLVRSTRHWERSYWAWQISKWLQGTWGDYLPICLSFPPIYKFHSFAIIIAGWHLYSGTSAYNFYVVSHLAAFAILTQSVAFLVLFDVLHKSLLLHTLRVILYVLTLFLFYYNAWYSYDLTGNEGYRAACPATCRFNSSGYTWGGIVAAGGPVYLFIVVDLLQKLYQRRKEGKSKHQPHRHNLVFRIFRVLAWITCIIDFWYSWITVSTSSLLMSYGGLIDSPTYDLNTWGFGQLVAMILVVLPLLAALQEWKGMLFYSHLAYLQS